MPGLTARKAGQAAARAVIRIDADAARTRAERNRADQRVSMFPDTDGVAILQIRGPAEQILAAHQALEATGRGLRAAGDPRTLGHVMCQTLVERVTGLTHADDIHVEVQLVMDAPTMLGHGDEPVDLIGFGPVSPAVADDLIGLAPAASIRRCWSIRSTGRCRFASPAAATSTPHQPGTSRPGTADAASPVAI